METNTMNTMSTTTMMEDEYAAWAQAQTEKRAKRANVAAHAALVQYADAYEAKGPRDAKPSAMLQGPVYAAIYAVELYALKSLLEIKSEMGRDDGGTSPAALISAISSEAGSQRALDGVANTLYWARWARSAVATQAVDDSVSLAEVAQFVGELDDDLGAAMNRFETARSCAQSIFRASSKAGSLPQSFSSELKARFEARHGYIQRRAQEQRAVQLKMENIRSLAMHKAQAAYRDAMRDERRSKSSATQPAASAPTLTDKAMAAQIETVSVHVRGLKGRFTGERVQQLRVVSK